MQKWLKISLLLCTFGFFREMRPSEPYVTEYLAGDWFNITSEQVNKEVYPFGTYSILSLLVIVFLITDVLRYKPIIVVSAIAGIILFSVLIWAKTLFGLQIGQVFYGVFMAAEVAYYTYIYAKVDRDRYQIVTGHTRAAILCGKFLGGILAQVLVSTETMDFRDLHFISLGTQFVSLFVAVALPSVPKSLYFYADPEIQQQHITSGPTLEMSSKAEDQPRFSFRNACRLIGSHTKSAYTNPMVLNWSIWWAFATCGQIQIVSYIQFLWKEIAPNNVSTFNGGVEAAATILGAGGALLAGILNSNKKRTTYMVVVCLGTIVLGILMYFASCTNYIWVAYINYILFDAVHYFIITIAGAIIAANLVDDSFGLVFGINTLLALILQTILTLIVVTDNGFGLPPRDAYAVYSWCYFGLAVVYFMLCVLPILCIKIKKRFTSQKTIQQVDENL